MHEPPVEQEFFVAALDVIIEVLNLAPDVAGATFMAAGSSAPELFVAAVAVFLSGDFGSQCHMLGCTLIFDILKCREGLVSETAKPTQNAPKLGVVVKPPRSCVSKEDPRMVFVHQAI